MPWIRVSFKVQFVFFYFCRVRLVFVGGILYIILVFTRVLWLFKWATYSVFALSISLNYRGRRFARILFWLSFNIYPVFYILLPHVHRKLLHKQVYYTKRKDIRSKPANPGAQNEICKNSPLNSTIIL